MRRRGSSRNSRPRGKTARRSLQGDGRLGRRRRRDRDPAPQGGGLRLSLFSRARPGAGHRGRHGTGRRSGPALANCRPPSGRVCKRSTACRPTTPRCFPARAGRSSPISRNDGGLRRRQGSEQLGDQPGAVDAQRTEVDHQGISGVGTGIWRNCSSNAKRRA